MAGGGHLELRMVWGAWAAGGLHEQRAQGKGGAGWVGAAVTLMEEAGSAQVEQWVWRAGRLGTSASWKLDQVEVRLRDR